MQSVKKISLQSAIKDIGVFYFINREPNRYNLEDYHDPCPHTVSIVQFIGKIDHDSNSMIYTNSYEEAVSLFHYHVKKELNDTKAYIESQKNSFNGIFATFRKNIGLLSARKIEIINKKLARLKITEDALQNGYPLVYKPSKDELTIFSEYPKLGEEYFLVDTHPRSKLSIIPLVVTNVDIEDNRGITRSQEKLNKYDILHEATLKNLSNNDIHHLDCYKILNFNGSYYQDDSYGRFYFKNLEEATNFLKTHINLKQKELSEALKSL
jgi:hypothetical protein